MTAPLVDGGWQVAILLGRRVIAWFAPLRSANPNEASRIQPTRSTISVQLCGKIHTYTKMVVMLAYL